MADNLLLVLIKESIMSIKEASHQAEMSYSNQQSHTQTLVEIKRDNPLHSSNQEESTVQNVVTNFVEFSSSFSTTSQLLDNFNDIYQRPISAKSLKDKMVLEAIFDLEIKNDNKELAKIINQLESAQANSSMDNIIGQRPITVEDIQNQDPTTIAFSGQVYAVGSELKTIDTTTSSQTMTFSTSGVYDINNEIFHSTFDLQLSEQRISITESTRSIEVLKDPLLVQFGPRPLGQLNGQSSEIDINSDNVPDDLPMFEGDVGYLVFDKNNNGKADGGHELFGPQSSDGFTDLSALDSNNNGFIDREDDDFSKLKLWQVDSNGNETWQSLSDTDIEAISLNSSVTPFNFYDEDDQLQAQLTQSSVALTNKGMSYGVHQVDVKI